MTWNLALSKQAEKFLRRCDAGLRRRITSKLTELQEDPCPKGAEPLTKTKLELYRVRVGDHRIVYEVQEEVILILVVRIAHRSKVYERL